MLLWCLVGVLLLRGAGDVLATSPAAPSAQPVRQTAVVAWPDDRARAFAAQFARVYLGYAPGRAAGELLTFVAPALTSSVVPQVAQRAARQVVQDTVVAGAERLDARHALVTIAARLSAGGSWSTRFLVGPVAQDERGGMVVYDLPAFAEPPARGRVEATEHERLTGVDAAAVEDVLGRFFRAFLAGRSDELEYLVPAGDRIEALADPLELLGVDSIAELASGRGRGRWVLATVRARDRQSGAVFALRYRVRLVRGDRWYVAAINTTRQGG